MERTSAFIGGPVILSERKYKVKRICVFCGSSPGNNSKYTKSARKLGETLTEGDITLVYGGSNIGLMGEIANAMIRRDGNVIGIIPQVLVE